MTNTTTTAATHAQLLEAHDKVTARIAERIAELKAESGAAESRLRAGEDKKGDLELIATAGAQITTLERQLASLEQDRPGIVRAAEQAEADTLVAELLERFPKGTHQAVAEIKQRAAEQIAEVIEAARAELQEIADAANAANATGRRLSRRGLLRRPAAYSDSIGLTLNGTPVSAPDPSKLGIQLGEAIDTAHHRDVAAAAAAARQAGAR